MDFLNQQIATEYARWIRKFEEDPNSGAKTVSIHEVLRAHFLIADYFLDHGAGIGGIGPRDVNLLHSSVDRQHTSYDGYEKWNTEFEQCASLMYGLVKDHPFFDANKRTALLVTLFFLQKNNRTPTIKQKDFEDFVVDIADNRLSDYRRYADMVASGKKDAEVLFIADFLKRNTRKVDRGNYSITYADLQRILNTKFSAALENASKNHIDIVRRETKKPLFRFGKATIKSKKLAQIGFPGWKNQVNPSAIKTVRECLGLTADKGVDSAAFFSSADPLNILIDQYSGPLRRLADR